MAPLDREKLESIFLDVADLPDEERSRAIENACGNNDELRSNLVSLVQSYDAASRYFDDLKERLSLEPLSPLLDDGRRIDPYGLVGRTVSHFRVEEHLGGGGMGVVYRARDQNLPRDVALKLLPPEMSRSEAAVSRFKHEVIAASSLEHQNIAVVYEVGRLGDGQLFVAMAYYDGETIKKKVERGPLPINSVVSYGIGICDGLAEAHRNGIIHRDVKPANIMVTREGQVKLLDFGVAKVSDMSTLTDPGAVVGTLDYMSPEQCRGEVVDARTDVWSTGLVLYKMLTGMNPFFADHDQVVIYRILNVDVPDPTLHRADAPSDLVKLVTDCLNRDPLERCQSIGDLGDRLRSLRILAEVPSTATVTPDRPVHTKTGSLQRVLGRGRRAKLTIAAAVVVLAAAVFSALWPDPLANRMHLAVLPFANVGVDSVLVDGLLHTVTSSLVRLEDLKQAISVVPTADVLDRNVRSSGGAASEFGVEFVVGGNVQPIEDGISITLELVDAAEGRVAGNQLIQVTALDFARLQTDLVDALADLLSLQLDPKVRAGLVGGQTTVASASDKYTRARGYLMDSEDEANVDAAINLLIAAVNEDENFTLAYAALGEAYLYKYRFTGDASFIERAVERGNKAVELNGDLAPVRVSLGMILYEQGDFEKAEVEFLNANALGPNSSQVYNRLGWVNYRRNRLDRSERFFKRAIQLKSDYWKYHNDLGIFYHYRDRHKEALESFRRVIELRPNNPWGYNNLGAQYEQLGREDEAFEQYLLATEVNPGVTDAVAFAHNNIARLHYSRREFEKAALRFEIATQIESLSYDSWDQLGNSYHMIGRSVDAREAWERVVEITRRRLAVNPNDREDLSYLAEAYAKLKQPELALSIMNRALSLERVEPIDLIAAAKVYELQGRRDSALHYVALALDLGATVRSLELSIWLDDLREDPRYQERVAGRDG